MPTKWCTIQNAAMKAISKYQGGTGNQNGREKNKGIESKTQININKTEYVLEKASTLNEE